MPLHAGDTAPFPCEPRTLAPFPGPSLPARLRVRARSQARSVLGSLSSGCLALSIPFAPFFRHHRRHADIFNLAAAVIRPRAAYARRAARSSTKVIVSNLTRAAARAPLFLYTTTSFVHEASSFSFVPRGYITLFTLSF
jgi:hypothetical protein